MLYHLKEVECTPEGCALCFKRTTIYPNFSHLKWSSPFFKNNKRKFTDSFHIPIKAFTVPIYISRGKMKNNHFFKLVRTRSSQYSSPDSCVAAKFDPLLLFCLNISFDSLNFMSFASKIQNIIWSFKIWSFKIFYLTTFSYAYTE